MMWGGGTGKNFEGVTEKRGKKEDKNEDKKGEKGRKKKNTE